MKRRSRARATRYRSFARKATIFLILISVVLLFTWDYVRSAFLTALIAVDRGRMGTLEDKVSGDAVFAGGSVTVTAPVGGCVQFRAKDGESVRVGQVIAEIVGKGVAEAFERSLSFARGRLAEYEKATEGEFSDLLSRLQSAYENGVDALFRIQRAYASGDVAGARAEEKRLLEAQEAVSADRAGLFAIEDRRAELSVAVASIASASHASAVRILSPVSGAFYAQVSRTESELSSRALAEKDATQLMALSREAAGSRPTTIADGQEVSAGDPIGRVVSGQKVSFFLPVKTEDKPVLTPGTRVTVSFGPGSVSEEGVISEVQDGKPPGYSVIAGEIPVMPVELVSLTRSIDLIMASKSGIVIPRSAILNREGRTGVLVVQKTYARFVPVDVVMTKGDRAVVKGIAPEDDLVVRAIGFLEGKRVR